MSEPGEQSLPLSIDVVRAKIFYLASDVESVSAPAAMLLRAVAESIDDSAADTLSAPAKLNGVLEAAFSQVSGIRILGSRARDAAPASERRLGVVGSQSAYKR